MPLESITTGIENLNPSWPTGVDPISQGDDHVRNTKQALQLSFPNTSGAWNIAQEVKTVGLDASDGRVRNLGAPTDIDDATRLGDLQAVESSLDAQIIAGDNAVRSEFAAGDANLQSQINAHDTRISSNTDRIVSLEAQTGKFQSFGNIDGINVVLLGGSGDWSFVRDSTGVYTVTFNEAATSLYSQSIVATQVGVFNAGADAFYVIPTTVTTWQISCYSANGQLVNTNFSFIRTAN
jgi:hypothetical protein